MTFDWCDIYIHKGIQRSNVVDTDKMIEYINRYGVAAKDTNNFLILDFFGEMSYDQIDWFFDHYKIDDVWKRNYMFWPGCYNHQKTNYILQKILDADETSKYMKLKFTIFGVEYDNLYHFLTSGFFEKSGHYIKEIIESQVLILDNQVKKRTFLFNLMLENVDLNIDKKRRFH